MTNLPKIRSRYGEKIGVELFIQFPDIYDGNSSYLEADVAIAASSLTANGLKFSTGQYIVIGNPGSEKTETIRIDTPAATTISLASNTIYAHNRGDIIRFIPYNQIIVARSTDGTTYVDLDAIDIRPDSIETYLQRQTDASTDYYKCRFSNSSDSTESQPSAIVLGSGYLQGTVAWAKKKALRDLGETQTDLVTDEFLTEALDEGRRDLDNDPRIIRWSFRTKFNTDIGNAIPGQWSVAAPTDLRDRNTNKNILQLRIGKNGQPLDYQDNLQFRQNYENIPHTTLNGAITSASTEVVLTSSGDFNDSGSVSIASPAVDEEIDVVSYAKASITAATIAFVEGGVAKDTITDSASGFVTADFYAGQIITVSGSTSNDGEYELYSVVAGTLTLIATDDLTAEVLGDTVTIVSNSANVVTSNTLTGVTGIRAAGHATGVDVWQEATFGMPRAFTIVDGVIYFDIPFSDYYAGENIYMDYYSTMTPSTNEASAFDEPEYDQFVSYLKWKIKYLKSNGTLKAAEDQDYGEWLLRKEQLISKEMTGQQIRFYPSYI